MRKLVIILVASLLLWPALAQAKSPSKEQQRAQVRKEVQQTLAQLYKARPSAKAAIASAAGYGAFSNFGMKLLFAGGGGGKGLVKSNKTKRETFMKMMEVQAGLGFGIKKFRVVFIFETQAALDEFVNAGWEFGGQTTMAAKYDKKGGALQGAISVSPGVWMYQLTDKGLAAEATGKGTKYYKDGDLN